MNTYLSCLLYLLQAIGLSAIVVYLDDIYLKIINNVGFQKVHEFLINAGDIVKFITLVLIMVLTAVKIYVSLKKQKND